MIGWRALAKIFVSLSLLTLAIWLMNWRQVVTSIQAISPTKFLQLVGICVVGILIMALRWWYMIKPYLHISLATSTIHYSYATFLNLLSPANLAGDAYRVFVLGDLGAPKGKVLIEILRERFVGLLTYASGYLVFLIIDIFREPPLVAFLWAGWLAIAGISGLLGVPFVASLILRRATWIERFPRATFLLRRGIDVFSFRSPSDILRLMLTSYVALLGWVTNFWILSVILGLHVSGERIAMAVILTEIIRIVPLTIQGIGIREGAFTYFIGLAGGKIETGFAVVGIAYIALACGQLICGFAHLRKGSGSMRRVLPAATDQISS